MKLIITGLLAAALALVLASCGPKEHLVSTPCLDRSALPPETAKPVLTGNAGRDLAIMTNTALELLDEAEKLRAMMEGCY